MSYDSSKGLLQVNGVTLPMKYMKAESYQVTRSVTDYDSYRDADGVLHRNALAHNTYKVEFNTPALMTNTEMATLMNIFRSAFVSATERSLTLTIYIPETDSYVTQKCYMPDTTFTIYAVLDGVIKYNSTRIAFIGY